MIQKIQQSYSWPISLMLWLVCFGIGYIWIGFESLALWGILLLHEVGHSTTQWLMSKKNDNVQTLPPPIWLPGVGAIMVKQPASPAVALAGAVFAFVPTVLLASVAPRACAIVCAFHLIALAPIPPFDGGWITGKGWWSFACLPILLLLTGPWAAVAVSAVLFLHPSLEKKEHQEKKWLALWFFVWAAWWVLGYVAPWQ